MALTDDPNTQESCRIRARAVAAKLGTKIPGVIARDFWAVPILEKLVERIESLEKALEDKQPKERFYR